MGIDINDVKILIKASFQYLKKTCYQWAKDHPLVSCVLLFFYLLYIFFPYLFSILFYTFPLVICSAILLGGPRFRLEKHRNFHKKDASKPKNLCDFTSNIRRPYLQSQRSRRTFGKSINNNHSNIIEDSHSKTEDFTTGITPTRSETESQSEEEEEEDEAQDQQKNKLVVEWTEDDQRNLINLGSLELERNKRLESLIAKRKARKLLSMQPRRNHFFYPFDDDDDDDINNNNNHDQIDNQVMGPIIVSRGGRMIVDDDHLGVVDHDHQPGSAPSVLLPTRNPFDLPYDPQEEKPVLTGGSFDEEFFPENNKNNNEEQVKENQLCKDKSIGELMEDPVAKSLPGFLTKPRNVSDKPGFTRFRRESDEKLKELAEELSLKEEKHQPKEIHADNHDEASTSHMPQEDEELRKFENPFAIYNKETLTLDPEIANHEENEDTLHMDPNQITFTGDNEAQPTQDHVESSHYKKHVDGDNDDESSSSSSSSSASSSSSSSEVISRLNVHKNEAFRSSVRKVLKCLAFPRNTRFQMKDNMVLQPTYPRDLLASETSPTNTLPTKMQERSSYTRPHHSSNFSIASDLQVEVSEVGSPTMAMTSNIEPNSPTEPESYDGDVDKDVNSGDDEELWGASPHPTKLGEFGLSFKLHDEITHRGSKLGDVVNNTENDPLPPREGEGEVDQRAGLERVVSSLSPKSILPDENSKKKIVVDRKSTDGDIVESRSSMSSSSDSLSYQMQSKAEHLVGYLASLPPSESGSNIFEEGEPSHIRESSLVESIQDEINPNFEIDENKQEPEEMNNSEGSQGSSAGSMIITNQIEAPKEITSSSSNEFNPSELNKELVDHDEYQPRSLVDDEENTKATNHIDHSNNIIEGDEIKEEDMPELETIEHANVVQPSLLETVNTENLLTN